MAAPATASTLTVVEDKRFEDTVLTASEPIVIDFFADYCGPCRLVEPALTRLDTSDAGVKVVKAKLEKNPLLRGWLLTHGVRVSMLPTLVLVRDGRPVRTMQGAKKMLDDTGLREWATAEESGESELPAPPASQVKAMELVANAVGIVRQIRGQKSRVRA